MGYFEALIYGVVQGLTEFLPISSSGHLALLPYFFHWPDPGVSFDLAMHIGTALAIVLYFIKDIIKIIKDFVGNINCLIQKKEISDFYSLNLFFAIGGTAIAALLIKKMAFDFGRHPKFIALNLIFFGAVMWACDFWGKNIASEMNKNKILKSMIVGVAQAAALFPGVSRSGITLSAARCMGITRLDATRFSFLLSAPIIFGGALAFIKDFQGHLNQVDSGVIFFGGLVSFMMGLLTIHYFLKFVAKFGLASFAVYRIVFGAIILIFL